MNSNIVFSERMILAKAASIQASVLPVIWHSKTPCMFFYTFMS